MADDGGVPRARNMGRNRPMPRLGRGLNSEGGTVDLPAADATPRIQLDLHPLLSLLSLVAREKCSILFREGPIWMG